ncbi:conserved hypothetical protein [Chloroherpeton thalassium ATCC 35110]|uniref:Regulatory protein GemA n=1 Tax=Chloroherpeton thalassium (strain ATCC 35110 / GB-78) TaxID=517418 RepID=B3QTK5_CHLT3|nr:regulatory protein GemA [Chloroherpeton thalassium]ACF12751.1 conserved hypothetical protein [Chloroherpeton thalassium ATCC 35110]
MNDAATTSQIKQIHILKKNLAISEENYRAFLSGFGVRSSKDLSYRGAGEVIRMLSAEQAKCSPNSPQNRDKLAASYGFGRQKYDELGKRPGMASPKQLRMIEAIWKEVSVFQSAKRRKAALSNFLHQRFNRISPLQIEAELVQRIFKTLQEMKLQKLETEKEYPQ